MDSDPAGRIATSPRRSRRSTSSSSAPACSRCSPTRAKATSAAATATPAASSALHRSQNGNKWTDQEAKRAFEISRLILPGNPEQSRFLLKPLHPDGGGSYTHNGPRRWQSRNDPEWQMLAGWVRGERKGSTCSK